MTTDLLRQVTDQIRVGQPLPFGVRDENGLLLAKGGVVTGDAQLRILIERGQ